MDTMLKQYVNFADVYDTLMRDVDYGAWAEFLRARLPEPPARVADCACGTGEMTIRLKKLGYDVTGVDVSESMLAVAGEKARKAGQSIPFIRQDMRRLALHRPADAVTCVCDGVNYLASREDMRAFFKSAANALKPNGVILFDISSRYKLAEVLGMNTFAEDDGERAYIWKNAYDDENKLIEMELSFFVKRGGAYERFTERHIQRAHSRVEVEHALEASGFEAVEVYGGIDMSAPEDETERLYFFARRRA